MYAVMWSEHCSYKSSRIHLKRLPTEGEGVLVGPGENAGVVDVGDGIAAAIRIESHNHPSAIEPYQGAATGVGGILRDIFTMGARPIALMDPLRFGPLDDARSRWIAEGVVSAASPATATRSACPTVGGEVVFDETYPGNPLVNVLCLGVLPTERLVLGQATGVGNLAVLLGSSTGRDGIGGVSVLASAGFADDEPTRQAAQRAGRRPVRGEAAHRGLPRPARRRPRRRHPGPRRRRPHLRHQRDGVARRRGHGRRRHRRAPPRGGHGAVRGHDQRSPRSGCSPSSSPRTSTRCSASASGGRCGPPSSAGSPSPTRRRRRRACASSTASTARCWPTCPASTPARGRPALRPPAGRAGRPGRRGDAARRRPGLPAGADAGADAARPARRHHVGVVAVRPPAVPQHRRGPRRRRRRAAPEAPDHRRRHRPRPRPHHRRQPPLVRRRPAAGHGARPSPSRCSTWPCVGARPLAVVNCLNFGNPEHPEVMWQLSEAIDGMGEACRAFGIPVVGGNVSLYNESRGADIDPTPVIGLLGMVDQLDRRPPGRRPGRRRPPRAARRRPTGPSSRRWPARRAAWAAGHRGGTLPALDAAPHTRVADLVRHAGAATGARPASTTSSAGGLGLALAEMAVRSGVGVTVDRRARHRRAVRRGCPRGSWSAGGAGPARPRCGAAAGPRGCR